MLLDVTITELRQIVLGLSMLPVAADLHHRLAAHLHVQTILPVPEDCRRVWWRSWKAGDERAVEWYDEAMCERIDRAVIRAMLRPVPMVYRPPRANCTSAIKGKLPPAKWRIVEALIKAYPKAVSKDDLAAQIEVSPTSGGYFNNLGSLRSLGLVDYPQPGTVAAQPVLFLE